MSRALARFGRRPSALAAAAALVLAVLAASATPARACSCRRSDQPLEELRSADLVVAGTVTQVQSSGQQLLVRLDAADGGSGQPLLFKAPAGLQELRLVTNASSAACGVAFQNGNGYLVYAHAVPDGDPRHQGIQGPVFSVSLCSRTALWQGDGAQPEVQDEVELLEQHTLGGAGPESSEGTPDTDVSGTADVAPAQPPASPPADQAGALPAPAKTPPERHGCASCSAAGTSGRLPWFLALVAFAVVLALRPRRRRTGGGGRRHSS